MNIENITDRTVCLDFKLSVEERIAESLYIQHSRANFKDAITPHDEWIKQRYTCSDDIPCLLAIYRRRITEVAAPFEYQYFLGPRDPWRADSREMLISLRLVQGILENIERHSILPKLAGIDESYFSKFWPHLSVFAGDEAIDWEEPLSALDDYPLLENFDRNNQISFGPKIAVDYESLNTCLKNINFSDFDWRGISFSSRGVQITSKCISFYFSDGAQQGGQRPLLFPLISSAELKDPLQYLGPNSCRSIAAVVGVSLDEICVESGYRSDIEYVRTMFFSDKENPYKFAQWVKGIPLTSICRSCSFSYVSKEIQRISERRLIAETGEPRCFFNEDNLYTCRNAYGEPNLKACLSGSSVYQILQTSENVYELRFWKTYTDFSEMKKPKTSSGTKNSEGRLECNTTAFEFEKWRLKIGDVNECNTDTYPRSASTMAYIQCEKKNGYCSTAVEPLLCIGIE